MITLTAGGTTVDLSPDLLWQDEFWIPVDQDAQRSITGSLVVQAMPTDAGRPITLQPIEGSGGTLRAVIKQCYAWASIPLQVMTLNVRGTSMEVIWRINDPPAIDHNQWIDYSDPDDTDYTLTTFKFLTV